MNLIATMMTPCVFINKSRVSDGEGGYITTWTEGATFDAAVIYDASMQARVAEKQGVSSVYTVTTNKGVGLEYHDTFKRLNDNKVFRVTSDSDDKRTPNIASFQFEQVTAEEWKLT